MTAKALVTGYLDAAKTAFATGDPTPLGRVVNGQILSFERAEVVAEAGRAQRREREYRVVSVDAVSDHGVGGVVVTTTIHVDRDEEVTT